MSSLRSSPCSRLLPALLALALPAAPGCGDDGHDHDHGADAAGQADADTSGPDATSTQSVTIDFAATVGGEAFACSDGEDPKLYTNLGTEDSAVWFKDFRFYVSNIRLINNSDEEVAVTLDDSIWQLESADGHVALLDFEDGSTDCAGTGNEPMNTSITGTVPPGTYDGIVFELGVPFALNHDDVATADAPLNIGALYWAWAIGHKFARIDYQVEDSGAWNFHLGSTMCMTDGPMDPPDEPCARPNRPTIALASFDPDSDVIELDAAAIVADSDLTQNLGGDTPGCQSFPADEPDCTPLFPNLGMTYADGTCTDGCADQTIFAVQ